MAGWRRSVMISIALTCWVPWVGPGAGVAHGATAREPAGFVAVVGDSLLVQARDRLPYRVWARNSRELARSQKLLHRIARLEGAGVLVIALGSVDVAAQISGADMRARIHRTIAAVAPVPCVVFVGVKVTGVSHWYNQNWERDASRWNEGLVAAGERVADWDSVAQAHPEYFQEDGMHFTDVGLAGYGDFIEGQVSTQCP